MKNILYGIIVLLFVVGQGLAQSKTISKSGDKPVGQRDLYRISRLARSAESKGNNESALKYWIEVNQIKPGYFSASKGIRRALVNLDRHGEAIHFLDTMLIAAQSGTIQLNPLTIMADRIDIYISHIGYDATKPKIEEILSDHKGNPKLYRELSNVLAIHRMSDDAIAMLYRGRNESGQKYLFARDLARWFESRMDWESAVMEYLLLLYEADKNLNLITGALGDITGEPNAQGIAVAIITAELEAQDEKKQIVLRKLLASLHFRAGRFKDALYQYQIFDRQSGDQGQELLKFANLTLLEGEYQFAREAFDELLRSKLKGGLRANVLLGKGEALLGLGKPDSAAIAYQQAIKPGIPPKYAFEVYSRLGSLEFDYNRDLKAARSNLEKALKIGNKIKLSTLVLDEIQVNIALTHEFEDDLLTAEKILKSLIKLRGKKRGAAQAARYELARLYFRKGDMGKSNEMVTSLLLAAPTSENANEALRMKALFNDLADLPDVMINLGLADLAKFQGNYKLGEDILIKLSSESEGIVREEIEWHRYELYSEAGFDSSALNALENIIIIKESLRRDLAFFTAGELYFKVFRDNEMAIELFERILTEYPESLLIDKARHLIRQLSEKDI